MAWLHDTKAYYMNEEDKVTKQKEDEEIEKKSQTIVHSSSINWQWQNAESRSCNAAVSPLPKMIHHIVHHTEYCGQCQNDAGSYILLPLPKTMHSTTAP